MHRRLAGTKFILISSLHFVYINGMYILKSSINVTIVFLLLDTCTEMLLVCINSKKCNFVV